jgi:uncharacterized protein YifE (UPF0438 family)|tara:strand:+ start:165 stop:413 length:249 start_codon:yes stop_codon:yes gene_type:complete
MALARTGKFADSIAKPNGIYSKDGVLLVANDNTFYIHSKAFMDAWNGVKAPVAVAPKKTEVKETKSEEVVVAPKKKVWSKKK